MAIYYNISGYQGDFIQLNLNLKTTAGSPISLDGYALRGQVRPSYGWSGVLLDLNPIIISGASGIAKINISSHVSEDLPVGEHVYDIERYPSGITTGNSIKLMRGKFFVLPEVTR